jgi:hypothetical protein
MIVNNRKNTTKLTLIIGLYLLLYLGSRLPNLLDFPIFTSWFADETYSLMVVWMPVEWASYKSINDLFDGAPSGFSYASHARIPGHGR